MIYEPVFTSSSFQNSILSDLDTDPDVIKLTDKVEYIDTCITLLEGVMRSLNSRSFDIKNAIEWTKFTNGLL